MRSTIAGQEIPTYIPIYIARGKETQFEREKKRVPTVTEVSPPKKKKQN